MNCPKCKTQLPAGATSCPKCGTKFVKGIYCPHCRALIPSTAVNCPKCGKPVRQQSTYIVPPETQPKKKPSKLATVITTFVLVLVVFGIIGSCMNLASEGKKELDQEISKKASSVVEPTATPTFTATPEPVPSMESPSSSVSVESAIGLLEIALSQGFGDNFTISCDDNFVTISVWMDGVALSLATIQEAGGGTDNESWNTVKNSLISLSDSLSDLLESAGCTDYHLLIHALNDRNRENTLLSVADGVIIYDALAD